MVHGTLHLLGYDHVRDKDATLMEGLEATILGKLGLSDPYDVS
jgi:probable rRNA maturation factor